MILTFEEIQEIIRSNPNKGLIETGKEFCRIGMLHLYGSGMESAIRHCEHFVSKELFDVQKKYAVSNKDMFSRLLQQEDMVFTAHGGSSHFGLTEEKEVHINSLLSNVRFGVGLRDWVKVFALSAYRADPMGVIMMEVDPVKINETGEFNQPRIYPTYKSINSVYDYLPNGRYLEYISFRLTVGECRKFGITDEKLKNLKASDKTEYYRLVDDRKDIIVHKDGSNVNLVSNIAQQNPIANTLGRTPAFVVSDIMKFDEPNVFLSPLHYVFELAQSFLEARSIRDIQKMYHGFAKAIEPLLKCPTCVGTGYIEGAACPDCTPGGADKGSGYKLRTKVSDVAKFPLEILENSGFDFRKIFGYVTPDIESWEKQDVSLDDIEEMIEMTYWGNVRLKRPKIGADSNMTATEVNSSDMPKESRLNLTADWVEKTENAIADFIGQYWFEDEWKKSSITLGREYILRTPEELMEDYQERRTKGAPDFALDEALEKYYRAKYKRNPVLLAKYLKMLDVEPFPHTNVKDVEASQIIPFSDKLQKRYFGEWSDTVPDGKWVSPSFTPTALKEELKMYVESKGIAEPEPKKDMA
ncbi:MAG: hypothetical protein KF862_07265 [Chitinophagaceae bacterium]|nr:hypothetical protein [Chitinophagaceae bacterium]